MTEVGADLGKTSARLVEAEARIAELEALLSVSRELNKSYVHLLRQIADMKAAVEILSTDDEAIDEYSRALGLAKQIARQALPPTEQH